MHRLSIVTKHCDLDSDCQGRVPLKTYAQDRAGNIGAIYRMDYTVDVLIPRIDLLASMFCRNVTLSSDPAANATLPRQCRRMNAPTQVLKLGGAHSFSVRFSSEDAGSYMLVDNCSASDVKKCWQGMGGVVDLVSKTPFMANSTVLISSLPASSVSTDSNGTASLTLLIGDAQNNVMGATMHFNRDDISPDVTIESDIATTALLTTEVSLHCSNNALVNARTPANDCGSSVPDVTAYYKRYRCSGLSDAACATTLNQEEVDAPATVASSIKYTASFVLANPDVTNDPDGVTARIVYFSVDDAGNKSAVKRATYYKPPQKFPPLNIKEPSASVVTLSYDNPRFDVVVKNPSAKRNYYVQLQYTNATACSSSPVEPPATGASLPSHTTSVGGNGTLIKNGQEKSFRVTYDSSLVFSSGNVRSDGIPIAETSLSALKLCIYAIYEGGIPFFLP